MVRDRAGLQGQELAGFSLARLGDRLLQRVIADRARISWSPTTKLGVPLIAQRPRQREIVVDLLADRRACSAGVGLDRALACRGGDIVSGVGGPAG